MATKLDPNGIFKSYIKTRDKLISIEWDLAEALYKVKSEKLYSKEHKTWQEFITNNGLFVNFKQADRFVWAWEEWHLRLKFPLKALRKYRVSTLGQLPKVKLTKEQANEVLKMINSTDNPEGKRVDKRKGLIEFTAKCKLKPAKTPKPGSKPPLE